jgi:WD40 repeat protein
LEHRYGALLLGHLLLGDPVPELGDDVVPIEVRFQHVASSPVDDLIVVGRTPDGAQRQVSIGVRRAPKVTASDAATARLLTAYLRVVTEHWDEVQAGRWRLALATASPNPAMKQVRELAVLARGQPGDVAFRDAVARPGRVGTLVRSRLGHLDALVAKAAAHAQISSVPEGELTWRLLHALWVRELRLEGGEASDQTGVIRRLQALVPNNDASGARALYSALDELCGEYAPSAAAVTEPMLRQRLFGMVIDSSRDGSAPRKSTGASNSINNACGTTVQAGTIDGDVNQHTVINVYGERPDRPRPLHRAIQQVDLLWRDLGLAEFTGRSELIKRVLQFIDSRPRGYVVIQAEAGIGKTALAAHLVNERNFVYHFTTLANGRTTAYAFRNLCAQLIRRYGLSDLEDELETPSSDAGSFAGFWRVLTSALEARADGEPIVIVIDGMDEFEFPVSAQTSLGLPATLPDGVFAIITSRFGGEARLTDLKTPSEWLTIDVDGNSNISDMRQYVDRVTDAERGDPQLRARLVGVSTASIRDALVTRCAGVWIYLKYVLDEIRDGSRSIDDVERLPGDLGTYYAQNIMTWRSDLQDLAATERWRVVILPLLATLTAIREPLPAKEIARLANVDFHHCSAFLGATARAFLNRDYVDDETLYSIRHESFRNVLTDRALVMSIPTMSLVADDLLDAVNAANARFVDALVPPGWPTRGSWRDCSLYASRHLAHHAAASEMLDALLVDAGFLTSVSAESILVNAEGAHTEAGRLAARALFLSLEGWENAAHDERLGLVNMWASRLNAREVAVSSSNLLGRRWHISASSADWTGIRRLSENETIALDVARINDRTLIVSGHFDGSVCVFDASTGASANKYRYSSERDPGLVRDVRIVQTSDEAVLMACWTGIHITLSFRAWNVNDGQILWSVENEGNVRSMATLNVDERAVLVYFRALTPDDFSGAGELIARDIRTGERLAGSEIDSDSGRHLSITDTGKRKLIALSGVGIFELSNSFMFTKILDSKQGGVSQGGPLAFDELAACTTLAVGVGNRVEFVNPLTGEMTDEPLIIGDKESSIADLWIGRIGDRRVALLGKQVWNVDSDVEASLWDLGSRRKLDASGRWESEDVVVAGHEHRGRVLAVVGSGSGLQVWEPRIAGDLGVAGSPTAVRHLRFAHVENRKVIIVGTGEFGVVGRVTMYDAATGKPIKQVAEWSGDSIEAASVCSTADRSFVLAGGHGGARLWDLRTGELLTEVDRGAVGSIQAVELVPFEHGRLAVLVNDEGHIFSYEVASDGSSTPFYEIPGRALDGWEAATGFGTVLGRRAVAVSGDDGNIRTYDLISAKLIGMPIRGVTHANSIGICEVDARALIVSCGSSAEVRCADPLSGDAEGHLFERADDDKPLWTMTAGHVDDRAALVAGGASGLMTVWDAATGKIVETNLRGHREHIYAVTMDDSGHIVSGGEDGALTWWDLAR